MRDDARILAAFTSEAKSFNALVKGAKRGTMKADKV